MPYAHSKPDSPPEQWHPLERHLQETAKGACDFAAGFNSTDWAWNAGWLHDVGKADSVFQGYLRRSNGLDDSEYDSGRVNHSSAGAALSEDRLGLPGRILAYLAAGHHAGLPDWHSAETGNAALQNRLPEGRINVARIRCFAEEALTKLRPLARPPSFVKPPNFHFWVRMLFSCLVDADYLDTEQFMEREKAEKRGRFPRIQDLAMLFFNAVENLERAAKKTPVNRIRAEIRRACEQKADMPKGMFSLTVPTGGGKTLSAMAFALRHALKHGHQRVIYVIPYTSIIEQTGSILADIFGHGNVVEHHCNLNPEKETLRSQLATDNWDAPIIVTTNVQFFESLYAAKPSRCRKLHNLVNSVVILDEAQLLPPELLTPCVDAMNELVRNYGVTLVLATATQPALPKIDPPTEIIPRELNLYERLKRTKIQFPASLQEPTDWAALAQRLRRHDQVLCVVNTRRDCHDLFKLMPEGTVHLSALMCGAHRSTVIDETKAALKAGQPVRVVSTQLVEAGVDIDFPVVYRALAGLDSVAQAAGRCNREGKLNDGERLGEVHVFVPPKPAPRGLLLKGENTTRELCALAGFDPQQPDAYNRYFRLFYSRVNDTGSQFHDLLVRDANPTLHFQFRTAAEQFKLIDDQAQQPVLVRYMNSEQWLTRLRFAGPTREIMRALQRYTVNLPSRMVTAMRDDGRLEEVEPVKAPGIIAQSCLKIYDHRIGLDVYAGNLPVEDLIQ
ncbi:MAG: CRISPR-associated endonuclease Cas3'' [Verrucomicrobia bacterium]|nr:CRISPR-associated endonuclease Cas3'' [Verrucomicrobiota bacterium]